MPRASHSPLLAAALAAVGVLLAALAACTRPPTSLEGRIYFSRKAEQTYRILWLHPESGEEFPVLQSPEPLRFPVPSPDGRKLAYLKGAPPRVHIYNLITGEDQQLTYVKDSCSRPTWSPDGLRLAYLRYLRRKVELVVQVVTGAQGRVIYSRRNLGLPHWSPRGDRLTFTEITADGTESVWIIEPDGENPLKLLENASQPHWAPDGSEMLVVVEGRLHLLDVATRTAPLVNERQGVSYPGFAPMGGKICAVYDGQVWIMNGYGTALHRLSRSPLPITDPWWGKGL